ncbi:UdgX family uracil-DNA binding protein [Piscinibacter sakaiensis]|uniref:UdgX family uracil-DNA binding protein n=1 Tax=Piscinibacter sakaiensis TaxID=1547922 RepID=UPI003AAC1DBA
MAGSPDDGRSVVLDGPVDLDGFRRAARSLIADGIAPQQARWQVADAAEADLFDAPGIAPLAEAGIDGELLRVPRAYARLAEAVVLHRDPARFALLYQLLWRLQHEPALRGDPLDPQWLQAQRMAHVVRREQHKMTAFVRFREIDRGAALPPLHVAWFEPEHHIVEATAPFFARRFAQMHWSILTPLRSVSWNGSELQFAAGASRDQAPDADAGEALWLTYYRTIFNPARLKLAMMRKEMPRRYWKNLPEASLIDPLSAAAMQRSGTMVEQAATVPLRTIRRLPASKAPMPDDTKPLPPQPDRAAGAAERAAALEQTRDAARGCTGCPLYRDATQTVFGAGGIDARLMFVGEQPGDQEDLRGQPFVGPAGQLLAKALEQLGVKRDLAYVTNAVKHFKFELRGKRRIHKTPTQREAAACIDWFEREIALVKPEVIIALGATAARSVLGRPVAVLRERGQWLRRDDGIAVLVTLHPSALLRSPPEQREQAYADWLADLRIAVAGPPAAAGGG